MNVDCALVVTCAQLTVAPAGHAAGRRTPGRCRATRRATARARVPRPAPAAARQPSRPPAPPVLPGPGSRPRPPPPTGGRPPGRPGHRRTSAGARSTVVAGRPRSGRPARGRDGRRAASAVTCRFVPSAPGSSGWSPAPHLLHRSRPATWLPPIVTAGRRSRGPPVVHRGAAGVAEPRSYGYRQRRVLLTRVRRARCARRRAVRPERARRRPATTHETR